MVSRVSLLSHITIKRSSAFLIALAGTVGLEPTSTRLTAEGSTIELYTHIHSSQYLVLQVTGKYISAWESKVVK